MNNETCIFHWNQIADEYYDCEISFEWMHLNLISIFNQYLNRMIYCNNEFVIRFFPYRIVLFFYSKTIPDF